MEGKKLIMRSQS